MTIGELFRNKSESCAGGLTNSERQMTGLSTHRDDVVPARSSLRIRHKVLDYAYAVVTRSLVSERIDVSGKIEIIVDRLRDVDDTNAARRLSFESHRRMRRVVAADGYELRDVEMEKRPDRVLEVFS